MKRLKDSHGFEFLEIVSNRIYYSYSSGNILLTAEPTEIDEIKDEVIIFHHTTIIIEESYSPTNEFTSLAERS